MSKFVLSAFADEIDENLDVQMDVLQKHNIRYIEMRGVNGRQLVKHTLVEAEEIKRKLDDRKLLLSSIGSPIGKIGIRDDFEEHIKLFRHTLRIAEIMQAPYIRVFSFFIPKGEKPGDFRTDVIDRIRRLVDMAASSGVTLLHENEKDIYGDIPERCMEIFDAAGCSNFKAVFDPANFVQCGVETYPEAYEILKDRIVYMHIKDALFESGSVVPAGHGDGKLREILGRLWERGYEGFLSLEPHLGNFKGFAELEPDSQQGLGDEDSGPGKFAIAHRELLKVIRSIGASVDEE